LHPTFKLKAKRGIFKQIYIAMNKIISKEQFSEKVFKLEIEAPLIARSRKAGHFVIVRVDEKGERMPLTIAGSDIEKGTIT